MTIKKELKAQALDLCRVLSDHWTDGNADQLALVLDAYKQERERLNEKEKRNRDRLTAMGRAALVDLEINTPCDGKPRDLYAEDYGATCATELSLACHMAYRYDPDLGGALLDSHAVNANVCRVTYYVDAPF